MKILCKKNILVLTLLVILLTLEVPLAQTNSIKLKSFTRHRITPWLSQYKVITKYTLNYELDVLTNFTVQIFDSTQQTINKSTTYRLHKNQKQGAWVSENDTLYVWYYNDKGLIIKNIQMHTPGKLPLNYGYNENNCLVYYYADDITRNDTIFGRNYNYESSSLVPVSYTHLEKIAIALYSKGILLFDNQNNPFYSSQELWLVYGHGILTPLTFNNQKQITLVFEQPSQESVISFDYDYNAMSYPVSVRRYYNNDLMEEVFFEYVQE